MPSTHYKIEWQGEWDISSMVGPPNDIWALYLILLCICNNTPLYSSTIESYKILKTESKYNFYQFFEV